MADGDIALDLQDEPHDQPDHSCCSVGSWRSWWASTSSKVLTQSSLVCCELQPAYLGLFLLVRVERWTRAGPYSRLRVEILSVRFMAAVFLAAATASALLLSLLPRFRRHRLTVQTLAGIGMLCDCAAAGASSLNNQKFHCVAGLALVCVCRVHPVVLFGSTLGVCAVMVARVHRIWLVIRVVISLLRWWTLVPIAFEMFDVLLVVVFVFCAALLYTKDYTVKVDAVLNGMVAGEEADSTLCFHVARLRNPQVHGCGCSSLQTALRISCHPQVLSSPLSGRSRRHWFYGLCLINWCTWGVEEFRACRYWSSEEGGLDTLWCERATWSILILALTVALAKWRSRSSPVIWDLVLAASALIPMGGLTALIDELFRMQYSIKGPPSFLARLFNDSATVLATAATILFLAGAHPSLNVLAALPPIVLLLQRPGPNTRDGNLIRNTSVQPEWVMCVSAMLAVGHCLDFRKRCLAIVQGLACTSQNNLQMRHLISAAYKEEAREEARRQEARQEARERHEASEDGECAPVGIAGAPARPRTLSAPVEGAMPSVPEGTPAHGREDTVPDSPSGGGAEASLCDVAVVRHGERADAAWDQKWYGSEDSNMFPGDPPLTQAGIEEAKALGCSLKERGNFRVVISSPYLRCVQTALVLADQLDVEVLLDQQLGEVYGPTIFGDAPRPMPPWRPWHKLEQALAAWPPESGPLHSRLSSKRALGTAPRWPESLKSGRQRYAERFLTYLRRARHARRNCVLVTHGHMLQACLGILPASSTWQVQSVGYCASLVARFTRPPRAAQAPDAGPRERAPARLRSVSHGTCHRMGTKGSCGGDLGQERTLATLHEAKDAPRPSHPLQEGGLAPRPSRSASHSTCIHRVTLHQPEVRQCKDRRLSAVPERGGGANKHGRSVSHSTCPRPGMHAEVAEDLDAVDHHSSKNAMVQDAALPGWSVGVQKIDYHEPAEPDKSQAQYNKMLKQLGPSWNQIEMLLGSLPYLHGSAAEFDQKTHSFHTLTETASSMSIFRGGGTSRVQNKSPSRCNPERALLSHPAERAAGAGDNEPRSPLRRSSLPRPAENAAAVGEPSGAPTAAHALPGSERPALNGPADATAGLAPPEEKAAGDPPQVVPRFSMNLGSSKLASRRLNLQRPNA